MATNTNTAEQLRYEQAKDAAEARRRRWASALDDLPVVDPPAHITGPALRPTHQPGPRTTPIRASHARQAPRSSGRAALYAVGAALAVLLVYVVVSSIVNWARITLDDLRFGRPRTTHLEAYVGHAGEQNGAPSHFVALNLNRRVVVVELPGGNTQGATTIGGPYLFGEGEELTPALLSAEDLNGDGDPDLLLSVDDEQLVYLNDRAANSFRLMTPEEHAALASGPGRGGSDPSLEGGSR